MRHAAILVLVLAIAATAVAVEMNSSSYELETSLASTSGVVKGSYFTARTSVENVVGRTTSTSYITILGFDFPITLGITLNETVTFVLEFNISGSNNDTAEVDSRSLSGNEQFILVTPSNATNLYVCLEDTSISGTPTYGIVFSGSSASYINLSKNSTGTNASFRLSLSQAQEKNRFVLPITRDGCSNVRGKFQLIRIHGFMPQAFVAFFTGQAPIDIILSYTDVDIIGDFIRTGPFKIVLEKNETDTTAQIIVRE